MAEAKYADASEFDAAIERHEFTRLAAERAQNFPAQAATLDAQAD